jgi:hypothetical protein
MIALAIGIWYDLCLCVHLLMFICMSGVRTEIKVNDLTTNERTRWINGQVDGKKGQEEVE